MSVESFCEVPPDYDLPSSWESDTGFLLSLGMEATFGAHRAGEWIGRLAVYDSEGCLDIYAMADNIGIPVSFVTMQENKDRLGSTIGMLKNELDQPTVIRISYNMNPVQGTVSHTYGHEIGHVFLEQHEDGFHDRHIAGRLLMRKYESALEDFCDYFGRQLAMPLDRLSTVDVVSVLVIEALSERYDMSHSNVILQLMNANKLPPKVYLDTQQYDDPGKVTRNVVCMDCVDGNLHDNTEQAISSIPVLDFRKYRILRGGGSSTEVCSSGRSWGKADENNRELNIAYDTWNDGDDEALESLRVRQEENRKQYGF